MFLGVNLRTTMIDDRVCEIYFPVKILYLDGNFENLENFMSVEDLQIGLAERSTVMIHAPAQIIFDFGQELHGGVRILSQFIEGGSTTLKISAGESVSECCASLGELGACNDHSIHYLETHLTFLSDTTFLQTGFRFVRLEFPEKKDIILKAVVAVNIIRKLSPSGSFICNDDRVNEIFAVASRTLMLNMQDYLWDGIKRDRLVWIGDMHPETLGIINLFGADPCVEKSLRYIQRNTPEGSWMNNVPTYNAWWLIIVADYYLQNANECFLEEMRGPIKAIFSSIYDLIEENGDIHITEQFLFDWPSHGSDDEEEGIRSLFYLAALRSRYLFKMLGEDTACCEKMLHMLSKTGKQIKQFKQCEAFAVYSGRRDAQTAYPFLVKDGVSGFSTFMSYYVLQTILDSGHPDKALDLMKQFYGGMLDLGATTFWEEFDLQEMKGCVPIDEYPVGGKKNAHGSFGQHCYIGYRRSLCHGWACGPIPFLIQGILGIKVLEKGCSKVRISPVSAGLEWYEISYPTPKGIINVSFKNNKFDCSVPKGVQVVKTGGER